MTKKNDLTKNDFIITDSNIEIHKAKDSCSNDNFDEHTLQYKMLKLATWIDSSKSELESFSEKIDEMQIGNEIIIHLSIEEDCESIEMFKPKWIYLEKIHDRDYDYYGADVIDPIDSAKAYQVDFKCIELIISAEKFIKNKSDFMKMLNKFTDSVNNYDVSLYEKSLNK